MKYSFICFLSVLQIFSISNAIAQKKSLDKVDSKSDIVSKGISDYVREKKGQFKTLNNFEVDVYKSIKLKSNFSLKKKNENTTQFDSTAIGTMVKAESLSTDSTKINNRKTDGKIVVPTNRLKQNELTSIEESTKKTIIELSAQPKRKNLDIVNSPIEVISIIDQKKEQFKKLFGFEIKKRNNNATSNSQALPQHKDTLLNSPAVVAVKEDTLRPIAIGLDTVKMEIAENGIETTKLDSINQIDSTNTKLQKLSISKSIENEAAKLVPVFNKNQTDRKIENLVLTPERAIKEINRKSKKSINQFDKGSSTAGVALPDINTNNEPTRPFAKVNEANSRMANDFPNVQGLEDAKLSSSKAQGFETVSFNDSTLNKMVNQLKESGRESYIKMTETYNPEKYLANANNKIENEQKKVTSFIENQEKLFSSIQNPVPQDFGSINHRIVSKDVLKGVDSLPSTESFNRYKEKVEKSANGKLKEIKIKEPRDLLGSSFTELDLSINQLDANSLNITPKLGYHFLKQLDMGIGLNVQIPGSLQDVEKKLGYEVFSRFNFTKSWYMQAQGVALIPGISNLEGNRESFDKAMLLGVGYVQKMGKKIALDLSVLHNPNQSIDLENYKGYQWRMKVGVRFYEHTKFPQAKKK